MDAVRFLSLKDVVNLTSLSRATIDRKVASGDFPLPIRLSERRKCFSEAAVKEWMAGKIGNA
jgi:prophage regulatory protein